MSPQSAESEKPKKPKRRIFRSKNVDEPVSETLEKMADFYSKSTRVTVSQLMQSLEHRGFALLMLVLVLPNCVPVPIPPGGSTLFSLPLLFIAVQMIYGKHVPWLPNWLRTKSLEQSTIDKIVKAATPRLRWIEKFLHPRLQFTHTKAGERVVGSCWLIFAISIAVPLPMTNFIPGVGTLIMALGMLGRDGLVVIIGAVIGALGTLFTMILLNYGTQAVIALFPFLAP